MIEVEQEKQIVDPVIVRKTDHAVYIGRGTDFVDITTREKAEEVIAACEAFLRTARK